MLNSTPRSANHYNHNILSKGFISLFGFVKRCVKENHNRFWKYSMWYVVWLGATICSVYFRLLSNLPNWIKIIKPKIKFIVYKTEIRSISNCVLPHWIENVVKCISGANVKYFGRYHCFQLFGWLFTLQFDWLFGFLKMQRQLFF